MTNRGFLLARGLFAVLALAVPFAVRAQCEKRIVIYIDRSGSMFARTNVTEPRPIDLALDNLQKVLQSDRLPSLGIQETITLREFDSETRAVAPARNITPGKEKLVVKDIVDRVKKMSASAEKVTNIIVVLQDIAVDQGDHPDARNIYLIFSDFLHDAPFGSDDGAVLQAQWSSQFTGVSEILSDAFKPPPGLSDSPGVILLFKARTWHNSAVQAQVVSSIVEALDGNSHEFEMDLLNSDDAMRLRFFQVFQPLAVRAERVTQGTKVLLESLSCKAITVKEIEFKYTDSASTLPKPDFYRPPMGELSRFGDEKTYIVPDGSLSQLEAIGRPRGAYMRVMGSVEGAPAAPPLSLAGDPVWVFFDDVLWLKKATANVDRANDTIVLEMDLKGQLDIGADKPSEVTVKLFPFETPSNSPIGEPQTVARYWGPWDSKASDPDSRPSPQEWRDVKKVSLKFHHLKYPRDGDKRRWSLCGDDERPISVLFELSMDGYRQLPQVVVLRRDDKDKDRESHAFWEHLAIPGGLLVLVVVLVIRKTRRTTLGLLEEAIGVVGVLGTFLAFLIHDTTDLGDFFEGLFENNGRLITFLFIFVLATVGVLGFREGVFEESISPAAGEAEFVEGELAERRRQSAKWRKRGIAFSVALFFGLSFLIFTNHWKGSGGCTYVGEDSSQGYEPVAM